LGESGKEKLEVGMRKWEKIEGEKIRRWEEAGVRMKAERIAHGAESRRGKPEDKGKKVRGREVKKSAIRTCIVIYL
jgi:hypothetical protein